MHRAVRSSMIAQRGRSRLDFSDNSARRFRIMRILCRRPRDDGLSRQSFAQDVVMAGPTGLVVL